MRRILSLLAGLLSFASTTSATPVHVSATQEALLVRVPLDWQRVAVRSIRPYQGDSEGEPVFDGVPEKGVIRLSRNFGGVDALYGRFAVTPAGGKTNVVWASELTALRPDAEPIPWPDSIKGVSNPQGYDDLVALGVRHVHINIRLGDLLLGDRSPDPPAPFGREVNGHRLRFNAKAVRRLDAEIGRMTADGINVLAVILNGVDDHSRELGLVNPLTVDPPMKLGAFNLSDERAVASYVGVLQFLAERYGRPDKAHGWIGGYIIGNEVDSHHSWHNIGPADVDQIARHYIRELRLADLAVRGQPLRANVFASLTHSWARPNSTQPLRNCSGKALLDRLTQLGRAEGDFAWHVAYHPYPQNLFKPMFWNDQMAMFGYDSPMITFKNLELLPAYLRREEMLLEGRPRRVILSEQGFHKPDGPAGEDQQAAAYALAYYRTAHIDGIDAFVLHRHVDSLNEGGLKLGLRAAQPGDTGAQRMGEKRRMWDVFQAAGTSRFEEVAGFALRVAGHASWRDALPRPGPFPDHAPEWQQFKRRDRVLFDLLALLPTARVANALDVKQRLVNLPDGGMVETLLLHPSRKGLPPATATFDLDLPADTSARLVFQTYLGMAKSKGVTFRVRVGDAVVFSQSVRDQAMREHNVDLAAHRGRRIQLTLEVDCDGDNSYDEAEWITPAVVGMTAVDAKRNQR